MRAILAAPFVAVRSLYVGRDYLFDLIKAYAK